MRSPYILTLSTTTTSGRPTATSTAWTLTRGDEEVAIARGGIPNDPHGDQARVDGRMAAHKHAAGLGHRIANSDVKVCYKDRAPRA